MNKVESSPAKIYRILSVGLLLAIPFLLILLHAAGWSACVASAALLVVLSLAGGMTFFRLRALRTEAETRMAALNRSQARFKQLAEFTWEGIVIHDQGVVLEANEQYFDMFGYRRDELIGKEGISRTTTPESLKIIRQQIADGATGPYTATGRRKDGSEFPMELRIRKMEYDGRDVRVAAIRDLSGREKAAETLRKSEERFKLAMEASKDGIWDWNVASGDAYYSPAYASMLGFTPMEISPRIDSWQDLIHPEDREKAINANIECIENHCDTVAVEFRMQSRDGDWRWISRQGKAVERNKAGRAIRMIGTHTDITDHKRMAEALEKRIIALTRPLESEEGVAFEDMFNIDDIQHLQDQFAKATGVASIITHPDGAPITRPSNFCRLCSDIIRKTEKGLENCYKSDAVLGKLNTDGPTIQPCLSGGLWDSGAGISVGGRHIANWLIGQVRDETQTDGQMRLYAKEIGADEEAFLQAFHEVPTMPRRQFEAVSQALFTLANQLSKTAYQNLQQARFISEKQGAEGALEESRIFLENMSDLAYMSDTKGNITWINAVAERLTGLTCEQIIGKPFLSLFIEAHQASLIDVYQKTLNGESLESTITFKTGITCHFTSLPKRNQQGEITGTFGVARDITERLQMEQALRESEQMYRTTFDAIPDSITVTRLKDGRYQYVNDGFSRITGYSREEVIGKTPFDINLYVSREDRDKMAQTLQNDGELLNFEIPFRRKDGTQWDSYFSARPIVLNGEDCLIALTKDVTDVKKAEAEKIRLEDQLRQAQKMESVGRLAGGVAHDFNNMLSVILGNTEMALDQADENSSLLDHLHEIQKAARRSADVTRQLLAFARKQTIAPKILDLNETVTSMLNMLRRLIGEGIALTWRPGSNAGTVRMDPSQIDQILANLCINARDAISDVGDITIETGRADFDTAFCEMNSGYIPGNYVVLSIADTGCGMDAETLDNLFEPFYTTKEIHKGTGLGLATVYGIVKQNNGFINVYSEADKGSIFKIYLPRCEDSVRHENTKKDLAADGAPGAGTILLVEDEPAILVMTARMLERLGYHVLTAVTPGEAVGKAREYKGDIDLLITDVIMPEMNGRELSENLLTLYPNLKRLFMSGYSEEVIAHHGILEDGVNFIPKPFSKPDLSAKVREMLAAN